VLLAASRLIVRIRQRNCRWVEDRGDGFLVVDRDGEREYRDDDVAAISYFQYARHAQGLVASVERHFVAWVAAKERPIAMVNTIAVGQHDPLEFMIARIAARLVERSEEQLATGGRIEGDGWRFDRWGLAERESARSGAPQELAIGEITGAELVGHELCIWRQGQEQAALRIPIATRNAHLLYMLLGSRVAPREAAPPQAPQEGLGRLLFEFGCKRQASIALAIAIAALVAAGVCAWSGAREATWAAAALATAAVCLLAAANYYRKAVLRCHEFGVFKTGLFRDRTLRYDQITTLTYAQERQFYRSQYTLFKGVYTGTSVSFRLEPARDSGLRHIDYTTTLNKPNENIDRLRNRVAEQIADLMESYLRKGQPIHWTTKLTLRPDGLEYVPKQFVGRRQPMVLPYEFVGHYAVAETVFAVWHSIADSPIVEEPTSQKNFYPGLVLFERLLERRGRAHAQVAAPHDDLLETLPEEFEDFE
jgi:hypothetical protein